MTVNVVSAVFHLGWGVADERDAALATVGVARELKGEWVVLDEVIEDIGLVHKSDDGIACAMVFPCTGNIEVAAPDGIKAGDVDALSFNRDRSAVVLEVGDSRLLELGPEEGIATVPAVMISG